MCLFAFVNLIWIICKIEQSEINLLVFSCLVLKVIYKWHESYVEL